MKETLETIAELMHSDVKYVVDTQRLRPSKSEVRRLCGDNTKILALTDWRPQVSLREGLQKTIDWICQPEHLAGYKSDIYNR